MSKEDNVSESRISDGEEIVVADIGGTHARFAVARVGGGQVRSLGPASTLKVRDYPDLASAFQAFAAQLGREPPRCAAFAVACPVRGDVLKFTNNPWIFRPASLAAELGLQKLVLVNDFGAVAHAVARINPAELVHIAGPCRPLPEQGVISVIGPGTGLGVALLRRAGDAVVVVETEGGHAHFAPVDSFEDQLLARLREKFGRVSIERIVSGPGLRDIYSALGAAAAPDDPALWSAAISGADPLARLALEKFCQCLGSVAGDVALTHGANAIVLAGGLPPRFAHLLPETGFAERLVAKGRYREMMSDLPVWLIAHQQPGLFGAAAAFLAQK